MTSQADRDVFLKHAKTFSLAARLFRKKDRGDVVTFYAFCREVDDCVDLSTDAQEAQLKLKKIREEIKQGHLTTFPAMSELMSRKNISPYYPLRLLDTLEGDLFLKSLKSMEDLQNYCLGVASTVGVVLCKILGTVPIAALPHAIDLGIAMQMTNIARDVYEDAQAGKIFIPTSFFSKGFLTGNHERDCKAITENFACPPVIEARNKLIQLTHSYYRSAERGYNFLPFRARLAIAAAAGMYEAIGPACEEDWSKKRAYVSPRKKISAASRALFFALAPSKPTSPVHADPFYENMVAHYAPF